MPKRPPVELAAHRARPGGFLEALGTGGGSPAPGRSLRRTVPALAASWKAWALAVVPSPSQSLRLPCPPWRLPGAPDRWRWFRSRPELAARRALPGGFLKALAAGGGSPAPVETGGVPCWPWRLPEGPGGWRRSPGPRSELAAHGARSGLFKMGPDKWPHFKKCDEVNV